MTNEEVLKAVFPLLNGPDLASCMSVSKQWKVLAQDDYFWKCLCAKRWPSICKRSNPPTVTFYQLYKTFYKRQNQRTLRPPKLSFNDLEFYIDIWVNNELIFSEVVPGPILQTGSKSPVPGMNEKFLNQNEDLDYKLSLPVEPRFTSPLSQDMSVSVLVGRKDSNKVACIIDNSMFEYVDRMACRAHAYDYLDFSPDYPFISGIRAWIALRFVEKEEDEGAIDVYGVEIDFCDVANSKEEVLWLLDMLDWK